ncbi:lysoplasmalogenase, partial [Streptomyces thermoviolaceus]|nr:lysoplasmalogenase [Streptomyces thermoviolaceus]
MADSRALDGSASTADNYKPETPALIATLPAPYRRLWPLAIAAALLYGLSLAVAPYPGQAAAKAAMGILLLTAGSTCGAPRERAWLCAALATAVLGDVLLALPDWPLSFVLGLGAFLLTHVC